MGLFFGGARHYQDLGQLTDMMANTVADCIDLKWDFWLVMDALS